MTLFSHVGILTTALTINLFQIMIWWFNTKVALHQKHHGKHNVNSNSQASQHACSSLCDELVSLWKLAALNPCIAPGERETLRRRLVGYHLTVVEKVQVGWRSPRGLDQMCTTVNIMLSEFSGQPELKQQRG